MTTFTHSLSSFRTLPIRPSPLSLKFTASFSTNCYCMHTGVCICLYILKYSLFRHMLLVCMFSGLTVLYWTANWFAFPWRRLGLPLPAFLSHIQFFTVLVQLMFGQSCWEGFFLNSIFLFENSIHYKMYCDHISSQLPPSTSLQCPPSHLTQALTFYFHCY